MICDIILSFIAVLYRDRLIRQNRHHNISQNMFQKVDAPTPKSRIICQILGWLGILTLLHALFIMFTHTQKMLLYLGSALIFWYSIRKLSYFCCIINQIFYLSMIWFLLLEMANKLNEGLYDIYLSSEGLYKMSSLVFSVVCLYFDYVAYREFKQISFEIYQEENREN